MRHIVWAIAVVAVAVHALGCTFLREGASRAEDDPPNANDAAIRYAKADVSAAEARRAQVNSELTRFEAGLKLAVVERRRAEEQFEIARKTESPALSELKGRYQLAVGAERAANQAVASTKASSAEVEARVSDATARLAAANAALRAAQQRGEEAAKALGRAREEWAKARLKTAETHQNYLLAEQVHARAKSEHSALEENLARRRVCITTERAGWFGFDDFKNIAIMECFGLLEAYLQAAHLYDVENLRSVSIELIEAAARIDEARAELTVVRAETVAREHPGAEANAALDQARAGRRAARLESALAHQRQCAADVTRQEARLEAARNEQVFFQRRAEKTRGTALGKVIQEMSQTTETGVRSALRSVEMARIAMVRADRAVDAVRAQNARP